MSASRGLWKGSAAADRRRFRHGSRGSSGCAGPRAKRSNFRKRDAVVFEQELDASRVDVAGRNEAIPPGGLDGEQ